MSKGLRLRPLPAPLHVVLVEPEIPPNTGNVGRLCAGVGAPLHLVEPLGFSLEARAVRRAGIDHWQDADVRTHADFSAFLAAFRAASPEGRLHLLSARAERSYLAAGFAPGDALVFGRESTGLPATLLAAHADRVVAIPLAEGPVRSLNLANAAAVVVYEALRQAGALG